MCIPLLMLAVFGVLAICVIWFAFCFVCVYLWLACVCLGWCTAWFAFVFEVCFGVVLILRFCIDVCCLLLTFAFVVFGCVG